MIERPRIILSRNFNILNFDWLVLSEICNVDITVA